MPSANVKQLIHKPIDKLPDNVTVFEMVMRREIELGLADSDAN